MWLANRTRPDIAFAVNVLARYTSKPTARHWAGVKRIFRYLRKTSDYGILYQRGTKWEIEGYADAGFKSDPITAKSQGGYAFIAGKGAISWRSKKQTRVATSTAHAELMALYEGGREAAWLWRLRTFVEGSTRLNSKVPPIAIHEDNEACIAQVQKDFVRTDATKHLDPMYHTWIKQEQGETLLVRPVGSQENTADIFTKSLPREVHWKHLRGLGLTSLKDLVEEPHDQNGS
jgi:ribonuclease HI